MKWKLGRHPEISVKGNDGDDAAAAAAADDDDDDMCHFKGMGNVCCSKSLTSHHAWAICFVLWVNTAVF